MPVYEYVCADCGCRFGVLRRMSQADDPICCESCHSTNTSRALSKFAAFSRGSSGESRAVSGTGTSCSSCGSHHCSSCHH